MENESSGLMMMVALVVAWWIFKAPIRRGKLLAIELLIFATPFSHEN